MSSWDLPDPPEWLQKKAAAENFTTNLVDWRYHGPSSEPPETITCTHRGLDEAGPVLLENIAGSRGEIYSLGRCEICGMVHWFSPVKEQES